MNLPSSMHLPPLDHVHSLRNGRWRILSLALLASLWMLMGCRSDPPNAFMLAPDETAFTTSEQERSAALAVLDSLQQNVMQTSFGRLSDYAFTQRLRTEYRAPDGTPTAYRDLVRRFPPPDSLQRPIVLRADSSGSFDGGWLSRLLPTEVDTLVDRAQYVLPDDPAYLAPRTREAFQYRLRPDTSFGDRPVRVVEIHAQPGEAGADRAIRHARLFVEPDTYELVGLQLVRADASLLFREDSRTHVYLQPAPDGEWVPGETELNARLKIPFQDAQRVYLNASYAAYRPLS